MSEQRFSSDANGANNSSDRRAFEISRRAGGIIRSHMEMMWEESTAENRNVDFLARLKTAMARLLPEAAGEIVTAFNALGGYNEDQREAILTQAADITTQLIAKHLSLQELEHRLKTRQVEEDGQQELSRGLSFDIDQTNNKINLHIPVTFFQDSKSALQSLIDGLKVLAQRIKTEDALKNITEIVGYSSLVRDKARLLTRYGFEVVLDESGNPTDEAEISREKLLQIFG